MGRRKSYQRDEVMDRALRAFWTSGYEGTSVKDLETATGLNKFGLYAEFGSKRGLYMACLQRYVSQSLAPFFFTFDPESSLEAPAEFLHAIVANLESTKGLGCFLLNAGVESGGHDGELNQLLTTTYGIITDTLERHWNQRNRAEAFTTLVRGLMMAGRLGMDRAQLELVIEGSRTLWAP